MKSDLINPGGGGYSPPAFLHVIYTGCMLLFILFIVGSITGLSFNIINGQARAGLWDTSQSIYWLLISICMSINWVLIFGFAMLSIAASATWIAKRLAGFTGSSGKPDREAEKPCVVLIGLGIYGAAFFILTATGIGQFGAEFFNMTFGQPDAAGPLAGMLLGPVILAIGLGVMGLAALFCVLLIPCAFAAIRMLEFIRTWGGVNHEI